MAKDTGIKIFSNYSITEMNRAFIFVRDA